MVQGFGAAFQDRVYARDLPFAAHEVYGLADRAPVVARCVSGMEHLVVLGV